jgi:hypothetical protein
MSFEFDAQRYQQASAHQQESGRRLIAAGNTSMPRQESDFAGRSSTA